MRRIMKNRGIRGRLALTISVLLTCFLGAMIISPTGANGAEFFAGWGSHWPGSDHDGSSSGTSLALTVSGLPKDLDARISIIGPGFKATATKSTVFKGLKPGTYTVTAQPVVFKEARGAVSKGSTAYPNETHFDVAVSKGAKSTATVDYGNIVDSHVILLDTVVNSVTEGAADDPRRISLANVRKFSIGQILTQAPSTVLPAGLFHRIVAIKITGASVSLTLTPAHLAQAFPQLDINSHLTFTTPVTATINAPPAAAPQARSAAPQAASALPPVVASLGIGNFRCQIPVSDSSVTVNESMGVGLDVAFKVRTAFGVPVAPPSGRISATLDASASLAVLLRQRLGCSANLNLPPLQTAIPVGPVLVPVYGQVGVSGSITVGAGDFRADGSAKASITGGIAFNGRSVTNLSGVSGTASASVSGAGKISAGPTIKFAVGVARAADLHLDVKPQLSVTGALNGSCEVGVVLGTQAGVAFGPFQLNQPLPDLKAPPLFRCSAGPPPASTTLAITHTGPLGAFPGQAFDYTVKVTNNGAVPATGVTVTEVLPSDGTFVSSVPVGTPSSPGSGATYSIPLGDVAPGQSATAIVTWRAPETAATLTATASARAGNAQAVGPVAAGVPVGTAVQCNPCGATAVGTGLRNRDHGSVIIAGVPAGATVGRAVLVWGVLYNGTQPANSIAFQGKTVTADVTSTVSGNLCWGDTNTVGYAADVTSLVTGNGTYEITNPQRGITQVDSNPTGVLPYTDGATLLVFYNGGGANNQVLSDFTYDTNTDADSAIDRAFSGVNSLGKTATLTLAGPDGQNNFGEVFTLSGSGSTTLTNTWDGSDPQDGPSFAIGNLWDTDVYDVSSIMPAGQTTLAFHNTKTADCDGVSAAVLQVAQ